MTDEFVLYQDDLDDLEAVPEIAIPGQPVESDVVPMAFVPRCHPDQAQVISYRHNSGVLITRCAACFKIQGAFALAQRKRIVT